MINVTALDKRIRYLEASILEDIKTLHYLKELRFEHIRKMVKNNRSSNKR